MLVNSKQSRLLVLLNEGSCTLYYRLFLEQGSPEVVGDDPLGTQSWARAGAGAGEEGRGGHWFRLVDHSMVWGQAEHLVLPLSGCLALGG